MGVPVSETEDVGLTWGVLGTGWGRFYLLDSLQAPKAGGLGWWTHSLEGGQGLARVLGKMRGQEGLPGSLGEQELGGAQWRGQ